MKAYIKTFVKEEKKIVKLCYQKGLLKDFKLKELYWAYFTHGKRSRNRKNKNKYKFRDCLPEVHYGSRDYWGEYDEHGLVSHVLDLLYWGNTPSTWEGQENGDYPPSGFNYKGRRWFIKYLQSLPTVNRDNKIKIALKKNQED